MLALKSLYILSWIQTLDPPALASYMLRLQMWHRICPVACILLPPSRNLELICEGKGNKDETKDQAQPYQEGLKEPCERD